VGSKSGNVLSIGKYLKYLGAKQTLDSSTNSLYNFRFSFFRPYFELEKIDFFSNI